MYVVMPVDTNKSCTMAYGNCALIVPVVKLVKGDYALIVPVSSQYENVMPGATVP